MYVSSYGCLSYINWLTQFYFGTIFFYISGSCCSPHPKNFEKKKIMFFGLFNSEFSYSFFSIRNTHVVKTNRKSIKIDWKAKQSHHYRNDCVSCLVFYFQTYTYKQIVAMDKSFFQVNEPQVYRKIHIFPFPFYQN